MRREPLAGRARRLAASLLAALALAGCAQRAPAPAPAATARPALEPPDGRWLVDDRGREYFLRPLPKEEGRRIDERTVRTIWRVPIEVVKEDDRFYYYKYYRPPPARPADAPQAPGAPAPPIEPPSSTRLRLIPFDAGLPAAGQWRDGFALADLNGDGHVDVVHGPPRKGPRQPVVFLGDGAGAWHPWAEARFPALPYDYGDAEVADLDGDGVPDVVLAVHLRGLLALLGDGRGGFREAGRGLDFATDGAPPRFSSRAVRVVDVDGDGRADIVALGDGPRLARAPGQRGAGATGAVVYRNAGHGAWRRDDELLARGLFGPSLAVGDFDADGRVDLALGSSVLGRTDLVYFGRPDGGWRPAAPDGLPANALVRAVAVADLDGDRRDDLVIAYAAFADGRWRSGIDLLYAGASGWTRRPLVASDGAAGASALAAGDVDGDGRPDVVALTARGEMWIFLAAGGGRFTREPPLPPWGDGCPGVHVALGDLAGDGHAGIVAAFAHEPSPGIGPTRCPSGGGIAAWRVVPREG